jgi:uncharacterized oxidoreductase
MQQADRFTAGHLHSITRRLLTAAGAPRPIADQVAEILVNSNLAGHDSHGVLHLPGYLQSVETGGIQPAAEPEVVSETAGTLRVDGRNGFGHYSARRAMQWAIEKARETDVCGVTLVRTGHIGRLGEYAEQAARAGCIGIITYGHGGQNEGYVAPFGGARGALHANPIAVGVPTGDDAPFILDLATSMVAASKISVADSKGVDLAPGIIVDRHGNPSVKVADFREGGLMLTAGGHKGYALSLLTCLLGGLSGLFDAERHTLRGAFMQVIRIDALTPLAEYQQGVRAFLDGIKATPPAPGFTEVLVPGDFEARSRAHRRAHGIEVPAPVSARLRDWAGKLGVDWDEAAEPADGERYR